MLAPVSTQIKELQNAAKSLAVKARFFRRAPSVKVSITGGLHHDCSVVVQNDEIAIGSDAENDVVLLDDAIAGQHAKVHICDSIMGPLVIVRALDKGISAVDTPVAAGGQSKYLKIPARIALGGEVFLTIATQKTSKRSGSTSIIERLFRKTATAAILAATAALGLLFLQQTNGSTMDLRANNTAIEQTKKVMSAEILRNRLGETELGASVVVQEKADGTLMATGRMTPSHMLMWTEISVWYDGHPTAPPLITDFQTSEQLPKIPPVAMVRLSEPRALILTDGKVIYVDHQFSGAWKVAAIEENYLTIARDSDREMLRFGGLGE